MPSRATIKLRAQLARLEALEKAEREGRLVLVPRLLREERHVRGGYRLWELRRAFWERNNAPRSVANHLANLGIKVGHRAGPPGLATRRLVREIQKRRDRVSRSLDTQDPDEIDEGVTRSFGGRAEIIALLKKLSPTEEERRERRRLA